MQKKSLLTTKNLDSFHWIKPDCPCWMQSTSQSEPYTKGQIISLDTKQFQAKIKLFSSNDPITVSFDLLLERSESETIYEDMVNIDCLNEAELLVNLQTRFVTMEEILTYVGPTLLIINPYKMLPEVFSIQNLALYQKEVNNRAFTLKDFKPHIYAIAADVFKKLFENQQNQAMVISGESGAGKTETVKFAMQFLTSLGNVTESRNFAKDMFRKNESACKRLSIKKEAIEEKILSCNPLLEAFGNAKTVRNDNSSRFGKYVTLFVNKETKKIAGASLINYLLEKSRIVNQAKMERNYHIFYYLLSGIDEDLKISLDFHIIASSNMNPEVAPKDFHFLNQSGCISVEKHDDKAYFQEVVDAMEVTGFSKKEVKSIWSIIASVLHLGNLNFDDKSKGDTTPCSFKFNYDILKTLGNLLSIDSNLLTKCLLYKTREINKQVIESPLSIQDCYMIRDSITKDLYERLFNWLIRKLNHTIQLLPGIPIENHYCIGLLDIFGFECFKVNSFEQLCINYTNEKLQQLFIAYVFKAEKDEFIQEGLEKSIGELKFQDNQPIIDLLEQPPIGIFCLLDESCAVAGDDEKFLSKLRNTHKTNGFFQIPKLNKDGFIVVHTAKDVEYNVIGFREKNKEDLPKNINFVFESSKNKYFRCIYKNVDFEDEEEEQTTQIVSSNQKSLSFKFRLQMKELMQELKSCECHFIRCLKPNEEKKANVWNGSLVLQQIRYLGVLDSIKVRKESFPVRRPYKLFFQKYDELRASGPSFFELQNKNEDYRQLTIKLIENCLKKFPNELVLYGNTKVFLKNNTYILIENLYHEKILIKNNQALRIQRAFYRYKQMKKLRLMFKSLKKIKTLWKVRMEYVQFQKMRKAARKIQKIFKKKKERKDMVKERAKCIYIQKLIRRYIVMKKYKNVKNLRKKTQKIIRCLRKWILIHKKQIQSNISQMVLKEVFEGAWNKIMNKKAIIIQCFIRGKQCRKKYKEIVRKVKKAKEMFRVKKATLTIQKNYRCLVLRKQFLKQKNAANLIKGYFLMKILSEKFIEIKEATLFIQRVLKPILQKQIYRNKLNSEYLKKEEIYLNQQQNTIDLLFGIDGIPSNIDDTNPLSQNLPQNFPLKLSDQIQSLKNSNNFTKTPEKTKNKIRLIREITPYTAKNIVFFMYLIDVDFMVDLSDSYAEPSWAQNFKRIIKETLENEHELQYITLGDTHTVSVSSSRSLYVWGSNDFSQLGSDNTNSSFCVLNHNKEFKPKIVEAGDLFTAMLTENNKIYVWGQFSSLQKLNFPSEITLEQTSTCLIKRILAKGKNLFAITETGDLFTYPQKPFSPSNPPLTTLSLYKFDTTISVSQIACSYHFLIILSKSGLLYSLGSNNDSGELGHNNTNSVSFPTLIQALSQEKVDGVECGYRHVICKTTSGKVFTWGWGAKGQLGHESKENELAPRVLPFTIGYRAMQVAAGYSCSIILTEDKRIFWFGSNARLKNVASPRELILKNQVKEFNDAILPVRVVSHWTKTSSVVFATFADMRTVKLSLEMQQKILGTVASKWQNMCIHTLFPPFVESVSKYFSPKLMKIQTKLQNTPGKEKKRERKNSSLEPQKKQIKENNQGDYGDYDYNSKLETTKNEMKMNHLKMIKERIDKLNKLGKTQWNEKDFEFMAIVQSPGLTKLLNI